MRRVFTRLLFAYLPPANEVWGKVMYLLPIVILSTAGGGGGSLLGVGGLTHTDSSLDRDPPDRDALYCKEWAIRILLECILVLFLIHCSMASALRV